MIDQKKIEEAVKLFLEGIGEDISREGLKDTPGRIARMCEELYGGMEEDASVHLSKTFSVDSSEMVIEKDITFYSTCEHHILPFYGKAHIAYIPDGKCLYSRREGSGPEQTGQNSGGIRQKTSASGTAYRADCGRADGIYAAKRRPCYDRGGAYVYDYAWNKETGQQNYNAGKARRL